MGKLLLELIFTTYNYTSNRAIFRTLSQLLTPDHRVDIFRVTSGELFTNPETSTLCELMISTVSNMFYILFVDVTFTHTI